MGPRLSWMAHRVLAMSCKYLGHWFDIHCGARIISLSITNEIAQNEACYGTRLANFWMHGHF